MLPRFALALCCACHALAAEPAFKPLHNLGATDAAKPGSSSFEVTPTGEAVWSMPLWTPPGRNGIEPRLALMYRSRAESGFVGLHFSIDGLSSVTRCWSTIRQDGMLSTGGPRGLPDKYCLDGQRLINRPGGMAFEMQPEFDPGTFVRVGGPLNDPISFTVFYRDGRIARFGARNALAPLPSNSVLQGQPLGVTAPIDTSGNFTTDVFTEGLCASGARKLAWFVDRIEDRYGNFLEVDYERSVQTSTTPETVELVPKQIRWTGFTPPAPIGAATTAPSRRVEFVYARASKLDVRVGFQAGIALRRSKLLEKIQVFAMDGLVSDLNAPVAGSTAHVKAERLFREYRFAYVAAGGRAVDRLASMTECVFATATAHRCLDPVIFGWTRPPIVPQFAAAVPLTDVNDLVRDLRGDVPLFAADVYDMAVGDFNGDGRDDILYRLPAIANNRFRTSNDTDPYSESGTGTDITGAPIVPIGRGDWFMRLGTTSGLGNRFAVPSLPPTPGGDWKFTPRVLDIDNDGSAEVVLYSEPIGPSAGFGASKYDVFRATCAPSSGCTFAPISALMQTTAFPILRGFPRRSFGLQTGDVNGDGKIDFIHENATSLQFGGDPTTLAFRAGVPDATTNLLASVTLRVANPTPPSNGNIVTRLFDERHMLDMDGNGQAEILTLIDAAAPLLSPRPYTFSALTVTGSGAGIASAVQTTLHASDIEASDALGSLLGHNPCFPPGDPTLRGMMTDPLTGRTFRAYTKLNRYFIDVNGDGLRDSVAVPSEPRDRCTSPPALPSSLFVSINTGANFRVPFIVPLSVHDGVNPTLVPFSDGIRSIDAGVRIADLDADGRDDLLLVSENQFQMRRPGDLSNRVNIVWLRSTGTGFVPQELNVRASWNTRMDLQLRDVTYGPRLAQVGDFNGDGLLDFVTPSPSGTRLTVTLQQPWMPDLVTSISGGELVPSRDITYARASIAAPDLYTKGQCSWPQTCLKNLGWVVASTSIQALDFAAATPTRNFTSYRYEDGRADVLGRGILGVTKFVRTVHDGATKPKVFSTETLGFDLTTQLCQDETRRMCAYLNAGSPVTRTLEVPISQGRLFTSRTTTSRTMSALSGGFGYSATRSVSSTFDWETILGPPATRMVFSATRTTNEFDSFGNVTYTMTETSGSELPVDGTVGGTQPVYKVERRATQRQTPDVNRWLVSRYPEFQTTSTDPTLVGEPQQRTRTELLTYEPNSVEVRSTTLEPTPAVAESDTTSGFTLTTTLERNERGSVTSVTRSGSRQQRTVTFAFHANDDDKIFPVSATDGLGRTTYTYNHAALGVPVAMDDANSVRTSYEYDALGRPKVVTPSGTAPTTYQYLKYPNAALGGPRSFSVCFRTGGLDSTCQAFDPAGRVSAVQPIGRGATLFSYDRFGRMVKRSLPLIEFDRDGLGRVTAVRRPGLNTATVTYDGVRTTTTDERAVVTKSDLDFKGRLVRQTTVEPGTQRDVVTRYEYGHFDRLLRIVHPVLPQSQQMTPDPGLLVTRMSYDVLGRLEAMTDPDSGTVQRRYNAFGDLKRIEDANGAITTYTYDDIGRATLIETPATAAYPARANGMAQRTRFTYDTAPNGINKLARIESNDGIVQAFEYDTHGRAQKFSWTVPGQATPLDLFYEYDAQGQVEYLTYPGPQPFKVRYVYGTDGYIRDVLNVSNPSSTSAIWHQISRDALGNSTEEQFGSTVHVTRRYDDAFQLKYIWGEFLPNGDMFQQLTYAWDRDGSLKSRLDLHPTDGAKETFTHDFLGRLEKWTVEQNCLTTDWKYTYDDFGNLRSRETLTGVSHPGDVFTYTLPAARTLPHSAKEVVTGSGASATSTSLFHDPAGHTTTGHGNSYTWSPIGLPWKVAHAGATQEQTLYYDGSGSRVLSELRTPQGVQRTITIGGLYELRSFGNPQVTEHVYNVVATDGVVAQVRRASNAAGDVVHFIHRDHLGNADAVTTETPGPQGRPVASVVERGKYEPFGERRYAWALGHPMRQPHAARASYGFTGHEPDDATGLINMGGRLYDARFARFISPDPMLAGADSQSLNRFSYVWNSPANAVDPSGFEGEVSDPNEWEPWLSPPPLLDANETKNETVVRAKRSTDSNSGDENSGTKAGTDISTTDMGGACSACHPPLIPPEPPPERIDIGYPERYIPPELDIPEVRGMFYVAAVADAFDEWAEKHPGQYLIIQAHQLVRGQWTTGTARVVYGIRYLPLDKLGRPTGIQSILTRDILGTGSVARRSIRPPGFKGGGFNHARGHLLGNQLGGSGDEMRNLVTMYTKANSHTMRDFENEIRRVIESGRVVRYNVTPIYSGNQLIPIGITLEAWSEGGFRIFTSVLNKP